MRQERKECGDEIAFVLFAFFCCHSNLQFPAATAGGFRAPVNRFFLGAPVSRRRNFAANPARGSKISSANSANLREFNSAFY
jgi:hypothetical protein